MLRDTDCVVTTISAGTSCWCYLEDIVINRRNLHNNLIESFAAYQYRLDNPMPTPHETQDTYFNKYKNDALFRAKVEQIAARIMVLVDKHDPPEES